MNTHTHTLFFHYFFIMFIISERFIAQLNLLKYFHRVIEKIYINI